MLYLRSVLLIFLLSLSGNIALSQCEGYTNDSLSSKIANYTIYADLDRKSHTAHSKQTVVWTNTSPDTLYELRMYMYLNSFKSFKTSYLRNNSFRGSDDRGAHEFGHLDISSIETRSGINLIDSLHYIQPNDGNKDDESVMQVRLMDPVLPGEKITLDMEYAAKLPRTFVRSGYGKDDFHLFVHWFPQMGVYEQDKDGIWGWNCHQFLPRTEFYADFGDYDVTLVTDEDFEVGATGCRVSESIANGKKTSRFIAYDVIDFGWSAYPRYEVYTDEIDGTEIELLMPPEHCGMAPRYLDIMKKCITYLEEHIGAYPYPKITVMDPPIHSLNSGFMEYPMFITVACVYGTPKAFRGSESLAIHEFTHQYFMGILASNEKEEAWLDEGFVTFFEDEILDHYYGDKTSFYDFGYFHTGNAEKSRQEFTTIEDPEYEPIAQPGWENKRYFKPLYYAKMATTLRTFKNIIGPEAFGKLIKYYYEKHKFSHPKEADWLAAVDTCMAQFDPKVDIDAQRYFYTALHETSTVDYEVLTLTDSTVTVRNNGSFAIPTTVQITGADGKTEYIDWDGSSQVTLKINEVKDPVSAYIDAEEKILLDLNMVNNSLSKNPKKSIIPISSVASTAGEIFSHIISFLF